MKKGIGIAVAIVVIVLIAIFANKGGKGDLEGDNQEINNQPGLVSMTDGENTVVVSAQDPGESVNIELVTLVHSGYVVIHEDAAGSPGDDIGTSSLLIGQNENVAVSLQRESRAGETLYAMLHSDDGDGIYTFPGPDVPLKDADDKVLVVPFRINGEAMTNPDDEGADETEEKTGVEVDAGAGVMIDAGGVVAFDGNSFSPSEVTIKKGESITFRNESAARVWPASAFHPTHTAYPGSDIKKCGTAEAASTFDACGALEQGQTYSFTFNEAGSWNYHDHLNPSKFGKIIVE